MVILTNKFTAAVDYAVVVHAGQKRKGTDIPYASHLLGVASLVLENGGDEDAAIAALLHDAPEDQGGTARLRDVQARFGKRVAAIVLACSDSLSADANAKDPWSLRKRRYVRHLRRSEDRGALLVACADKLHNARAILRDLREAGPRLWKRFTANGEKTPEMILGYYEACAAALEKSLPVPLSGELRRVAKELARESGKRPDRSWEG
jgi:(p)ppGpp synthase/HD superfamily hydrolase